MEKNDRNAARWVEERLSSLEPAVEFRPDVRKALARVQERDRRYRVTCLRWFWGCAAAAAVFMVAMAVPLPCNAASSNSCKQPVGSRLWDSVFSKPAQPNPVVVAEGPHSVPALTPQPAATPEIVADNKPAPAPRPHPAPPKPQSTVPGQFKISGSPNAPITVEIYSDYECPMCAQSFLNVIPLLEAEYVQTGKVQLIHRDFPLRMHPYARTAARWANAAGRAGAYDLVAKQLFRTQAQWAQNGDVESQVALVLSPQQLKQVRDLLKNHPEWDDTVDSDTILGVQDHIDRTPSLVVVFRGKRQVIAGVPAFQLLQGYLNDLLAK